MVGGSLLHFPISAASAWHFVCFHIRFSVAVMTLVPDASHGEVSVARSQYADSESEASYAAWRLWVRWRPRASNQENVASNQEENVAPRGCPADLWMEEGNLVADYRKEPIESTSLLKVAHFWTANPLYT